MITINGRCFYEEPTSCGTCPFLYVPGRDAPSFLPSRGSANQLCHCTMWDEMHRVCTSPPRRCAKLFRKALAFPDGAKLVIVAEKRT